MSFLLRPWAETDIDSVCRYANNPKIAANLRNTFPTPYTYADARAYIRDCRAAGEDRQLTRAIEADGAAAGSIGLFFGSDVYEKSAELGYWLGEPFWGKGIMSEAIRQICACGFENFDIVRIYAEPFAFNVGSRRALEKAGFTLEGILRKSVYKNGMYHDSCVFALLR